MRLSSLILISFFCTSSFAQELVPLPSDKSRDFKFNHHHKLKTAATDTISIPFLEDFYLSNLFPDSSMFVPGGGTFINNNFPINPPSANVATFDGLDRSGAPYSESNPFDRGKCDELTSQAINLSTVSNVYMSFWWQAQGNAVPQVTGDSIQLSFLTDTNSWEVVWTRTGDNDKDGNIDPQGPFSQVRIALDPAYLHGGFQFKFESFGNQSGMFGVWHIDYIYIDDNLSIGDSTMTDMAFSNMPSSYLEEYWAMPIDQFFANPTQEIADSTTTTFNNFKLDPLIPLPYKIFTSGEEININNGSSTIIRPLDSFFVDPLKKQVKISGANTNFLTLGVNEITIKNKFTLDGDDQIIGDPTPTGIADFALTHNDTISSFTTLGNYYARDDGSAEQAFRVTSEGAFVLQEYGLNRDDTLHGVAIYYPNNPYGYDSTELVLMVWQRAEGEYEANDILYDERVLISLADSVNGFTYYNFQEPVPLTGDKFYVGYKQDTEDDILIGYDLNTSLPTSPIYFNSTGTWQNYIGPGVLMIRPLMERYAITSIDHKIITSPIQLYPNPTDGRVYFSESISRLQIYDIAGKLIFSKNDYTNEVNLSGLKNGIYFVNLFNKEGLIQREKLILTK